uniref:18 kDa Sin3-associated polypeptide n=1 Tax=Cacopsylla melanoneura TaxID=428564 RepID=A0A8D9BNU5_9HEMI
MTAVESFVTSVDEKTVDREKTCPLLLRVFTNFGKHNNVSDYTNGFPPNQLQIYTWMDATLRELTNLIREVNPEAQQRGTCFYFTLLTPERGTSRFHVRDIGQTICGQKGPDDNKSLQMSRFIIGDYMDVKILPPKRNMRI